MIARRSTTIAVLALALFATPVLAADGTITAIGTGQAKVKPQNRHRNAAIVKAVEAAYHRSVPRAIADARDDARGIAKAAGLTLGPIQSVDETLSDGYYGGVGNFAPFGPNRYCGKQTRVVHRRDSQGRLHRVRRTQKRCIVPDFATSTLAVTFAATPEG
jgi:hypothetical protein